MGNNCYKSFFVLKYRLLVTACITVSRCKHFLNHNFMGSVCRTCTRSCFSVRSELSQHEWMNEFCPWTIEGGIALCRCSMLALHIAVSSSSRTEHEAQWSNRLRTVISSARPVKCLTDIPKRRCLGIAHCLVVTGVFISCANKPADCLFFSDASFFSLPSQQNGEKVFQEWRRVHYSI